MSRGLSAFLASLLLAAIAGCSSESETPATPRELTPRELELTGGEYVDPSLFPKEEDVPLLTCRLEWVRCDQYAPEPCCYGPCYEGSTRPYCIGCLPPGMPCIQNEQCCGRCSRECSLRDETCSGICLLGETGDLCHYDTGCRSGRCVDFECR